MSLPERPKALRVNSLYFGVVLAMIFTLSLSFLVFRAISQRVQENTIIPTFDGFDELQVESAQANFKRGGTPELTRYLNDLDRIFGGEHYLLNAQGIDMVSGENRFGMLPAPPATMSRVLTRGHWVISHRSKDGMYWFTAEGQLGPPHIWAFLPYYFLVIGATGALCWLFAGAVVSPVRRIAHKIALFGHGNLSVRVETTRQDEIGQLGRSFNQMAERLERLIVSERRLLGDISHELRSPLARLKFATKLARTSTDSKSALDRIDRDVDRITSLVADIVEITTIEGDPALRASEVFSVETIVAAVVDDCNVEAQFRECTIDVEGSIPSQLLGNRELLRRAIENVLRNAIRYTPERKAIQLKIREEDGNAFIAIRDYGPGVPEEALSRIFDPFFRVEEARDTNGGGSGLGLSIAKRAVQLHHGVITAQNASPGLCVQIRIPVAGATLAH